MVGRVVGLAPVWRFRPALLGLGPGTHRLAVLWGLSPEGPVWPFSLGTWAWSLVPLHPAQSPAAPAAPCSSARRWPLSSVLCCGFTSASSKGARHPVCSTEGALNLGFSLFRWHLYPILCSCSF